MLTARSFDFANATINSDYIHAMVQRLSDPYRDTRFLPIVDENTGQELPPETVTAYKYLISRNARFDIVSNLRWDLFKAAVDANSKLAIALESKRLPNGQRTDEDRVKMQESRYDAYKFQVTVQLNQFERADGTTFWGDNAGTEFSHSAIRDKHWVGLELGPGPEGGVYVLDIVEVPRAQWNELVRRYYPELFAQPESSDSKVVGTIGAGKAPVGKTPAEKSPQGTEVDQD